MISTCGDVDNSVVALMWKQIRHHAIVWSKHENKFFVAVSTLCKGFVFPWKVLQKWQRQGRFANPPQKCPS